jgi:hypothetical protein
VICLNHYGYQLLANPLKYSFYCFSLDEYKALIRTVIKYRIAVIPYYNSRRVLKIKKFGIVINAREYYNIIRNIISYNAIFKTINRLFIPLEKKEFIYKTRVKKKLDEENKPIKRKLI